MMKMNFDLQLSMLYDKTCDFHKGNNIGLAANPKFQGLCSAI